MAGSWEIKNNQKVLVSILHTETTTVAWSMGLRNLVIPGGIMGLVGMPYDMARNVACLRALQGGFDWSFHLDSDVIPPRDAILRLMAHQQPIVSGMYCRRSHPVGVPVMLSNGQWITHPPENSLIEVDLVGAGCLLIHRSVLESLPPQRPGCHWFDWRVNMQGILPPGECLSEDFNFCTHARKHGYKILADTSVKCRHVGYSECTYASIGPLDANPNT